MNESISARLKRLRKQKKLSQVQLAQLAGVGQSAIGNIEAGTRGYGKSVIKVAAALGTNPDYLMLDSDDPSPSAALPTAPVPYEAIRFGKWLYKIKDDDLRERTADAAMQVIYRVVDGLSAQPLPPPTPTPAPANKKRRVERQDR